MECAKTVCSKLRTANDINSYFLTLYKEEISSLQSDNLTALIVLELHSSGIIYLDTNLHHLVTSQILLQR
jgi:hypothetical protein